MSKTARPFPAFIDLAVQRERLGDRVGRAIAAVLERATFWGPGRRA
jgi:hypothetical protein